MLGTTRTKRNCFIWQETPKKMVWYQYWRGMPYMEMSMRRAWCETFNLRRTRAFVYLLIWKVTGWVIKLRFVKTRRAKRDERFSILRNSSDHLIGWQMRVLWLLRTLSCIRGLIQRMWTRDPLSYDEGIFYERNSYLCIRILGKNANCFLPLGARFGHLPFPENTGGTVIYLSRRDFVMTRCSDDSVP